MSSRRNIILVAAIAIGAVAAFLVWGYVGGIQNKAYGNAQKVTVYMVRKDIAKGTYTTEAEKDGDIVKTQIPKQFYPSDAVRNIDTDIAGKVSINDIPVNEILTTDMFADPGVVQATFADRLTKIRGVDQVAISIQVSTIAGVASLLQPGDYVNIMADTGCESSSSTSGSSVGSSGTSSSSSTSGSSKPAGPSACSDGAYFTNARYVFQKAQILAIGQTPVAQPGDVQSASSSSSNTTPAPVANSGLITLIVPATSAQIIASLSSGSIYLTLVSRDYKPVPMGPIDGTKPLPGEDPTQLTPYGPLGPGN